jgi:hypothetical protein
LRPQTTIDREKVKTTSNETQPKVKISIVKPVECKTTQPFLSYGKGLLHSVIREVSVQTGFSLTDQDRVESLKAAALTGFIAGLVAAALLLTHRAEPLGWSAALASTVEGFGGVTFWVSVAIATLSGSLFGITYRYAVRQDSSSYLRSGVIFAFSLVRGLALVNVAAAISLRGWPFLIACTESLLMFALAGAGLEVALRQQWIRTVKGTLGEIEDTGPEP